MSLSPQNCVKILFLYLREKPEQNLLKIWIFQILSYFLYFQFKDNICQKVISVFIFFKYSIL